MIIKGQPCSKASISLTQHSNYITSVSDIIECGITSCNGQGVCEVVDTAQLGCKCAPGFEGAECGVNIDECGSSPCENDGTCKDGIDEYVCSCAWDYIGRHCGTRKFDCHLDL